MKELRDQLTELVKNYSIAFVLSELSGVCSMEAHRINTEKLRITTEDERERGAYLVLCSEIIRAATVASQLRL